jgi:hypothetical protein
MAIRLSGMACIVVADVDELGTETSTQRLILRELVREDRGSETRSRNLTKGAGGIRGRSAALTSKGAPCWA